MGVRASSRLLHDLYIAAAGILSQVVANYASCYSVVSDLSSASAILEVNTFTSSQC